MKNKLWICILLMLLLLCLMFVLYHDPEDAVLRQGRLCGWRRPKTVHRKILQRMPMSSSGLLFIKLMMMMTCKCQFYKICQITLIIQPKVRINETNIKKLLNKVSKLNADCFKYPHLKCKKRGNNTEKSKQSLWSCEISFF